MCTYLTLSSAEFDEYKNIYIVHTHALCDTTKFMGFCGSISELAGYTEHIKNVPNFLITIQIARLMLAFV